MNDLLMSETPAVAPPPWGRLTRVSPARWRVADLHGHIVGHLAGMATETGWRYTAERYHAATRRFRLLGEFWSPDDALACLRYLA